MTSRVGAALSAACLLGLAPSAFAKTVIVESNFGQLTRDIYYGTIAHGVDGAGQDVTGQTVVADFLRSAGLRTTSSLTYIGGYGPNFQQIDELASYATLSIGAFAPDQVPLGLRFFTAQAAYALAGSGPAALICGQTCEVRSIRGASASSFLYARDDVHHFSLGASILAPVANAAFPANLTDYVDYTVQAGDSATGEYDDTGSPYSSALGTFAISRLVGGAAHYRIRQYDDGSTSFDVVFDHQSAAPEPASWALLIAGFGLAGAAIRRRGTLRAGRWPR